MDDGKEDVAVRSAAAAAPLAAAQPSTAAAAAAAQPPAAVAPFRLTVQAMSGAQRRHQSSAALARIVRAADPSGAVASMGGRGFHFSAQPEPFLRLKFHEITQHFPQTVRTSSLKAGASTRPFLSST